MSVPTFWSPTWPDTNQVVQLQKMAWGLYLEFEEKRDCAVTVAKNKGADQLYGLPPS